MCKRPNRGHLLVEAVEPRSAVNLHHALMPQAPRASTPTEVLAGLVDRVTFHNSENGFCVLRVKARGQRDLTTLSRSSEIEIKGPRCGPTRGQILRLIPAMKCAVVTTHLNRKWIVKIGQFVRVKAGGGPFR